MTITKSWEEGLSYKLVSFFGTLNLHSIQFVYFLKFHKDLHKPWSLHSVGDKRIRTLAFTCGCGKIYVALDTACFQKKNMYLVSISNWGRLLIQLPWMMQHSIAWNLVLTSMNERIFSSFRRCKNHFEQLSCHIHHPILNNAHLWFFPRYF